jgi:aryl-alcohol dehydrogenase-like predicted oxidoreductase
VSLEAGAKHEVKDHSTENFMIQVEETASLLGEYLNLYQIHSATFDSGILTDRVAHQALADCRKERGWAIGLSVSGPEQDDILRQAMAIKVDGDRLFDSVQCTFNLLEQKAGSALQEAADTGMDIIIKEGMANGRVLRNEKVADYALKLSCAADQLALAFILAQGFDARVLSGAVTSDQLASNWKALEVAETLRKQPLLLESLAKDCVVLSEDYWNERSALSWN